MIGRQPGVFGLALVLLLWLGLHLPGLGTHGLWDPWEMDRAHIARRMTEPPRVLVVERRPDSGGLGPIARWLDLRYSQGLYVATPDPGPTNTISGPKGELRRARALLEREVFTAVILDAQLVAPDPGELGQVKELVPWIETFVARNPGTELILAVPVPDGSDPSAPDADEYMRLLREAYGHAHVELIAAELTGNTIGRPGIFRRQLIKVLKDAAAGKDGHYVVKELIEELPEGTFLEKAFWRASRSHNLADRMSRRVDPAESEELSRAPAIAMPAVTPAPWPRGRDWDDFTSDFTTGEKTARDGVASAVASLEGILDRHARTPLFRAQLKDPNGYTRSLAPLDYWLMAGSYNTLGFSELASRLPAFLFGLFALLLLFRVALLIWGPAVATLSGVVLSTTPLFFGAARSVSGDVSLALALVLVGGGLARAVHSGRLLRGPLFWVVGGATLAFFAHGLFGLLLCAALAVSYLLVARDWRLASLLPAGLLCGALGLAWWVVPGDGAWTFWSHFGLESPLLSWKLSAEDRPVLLNFDRLVRQVGFGAAPWSVLLPFAFGLLVTRRIPSGDRASLVVVLWFAVPWFVQALLLKDAHRFIFPAVPALAIATALLLARVLDGKSLGSLAALVGAIVLGLLVSNVGKSPEPLTTFLTTDPPLTGANAVDYPESFKLPKAVKLALTLFAVLLLLHGARIASRARRVGAYLRRPIPFWIATTSVLALCVLRFGYTLQASIADSFLTPLGASLEPIHRLFVRNVLYWHPATLALGGIAVVAWFGLIRYHTQILQRQWAWFKSWILTSFNVAWAALIMAAGALGAAAAAYADGGLGDALLEVDSLFRVCGLFGGLAIVASTMRRRSDDGVLFVASVLLCPALVPVAGWLAAAMVLGTIVLAGLIGYVLARLRVPSVTPGRVIALVVGALGLWLSADASLAALPAQMGARALLVASVISLTTLGDRLRAAVPKTPLLSGLGHPFAGIKLSGYLLTVFFCALATALSAPFEHIVDVTGAPPALAWGAYAALGLALAPAVWRAAPIRGAIAVLGGGALAGGLALLPGYTLAVLLVPGLLLLTLVLGPLGLAARIRTVIARLVSRVVGRFPARGTSNSLWIHAGLMVGLAALALLFLLGWGELASRPRVETAAGSRSLIVWLTIDSPLLRVGALLLLGLGGLAWVLRSPSLTERILPSESLLSPLRIFSRRPVMVLTVASVVTFVFGGLVAQLFGESGLTNIDYLVTPLAQRSGALGLRIRGFVIVTLLVLSGLLLVSALWHRVKADRRVGFALGLAAAGACSLVVLVALVRKWTQLEPAVQGPDADRLLPYLFAQSSRTQLLYLAVLAMLATGLRAAGPTILAALRPRRARLEVAAVVLVGLLGVMVSGVLGELTGRAVAAVLAAACAVLIVLDVWPWRLDVIRWGSIATACLVLVSFGATGLVSPLSAAALLLIPVGCLYISASEPAVLEPFTRTWPLLARGASQVLIGGLVLLIPLALAAVAGTPELLAWTAKASVLVVGGLFLVWGILAAMRLGLGVADLIETASIRSEAAHVSAAVAVALVISGHLTGQALGPWGVFALVSALLLLGAIFVVWIAQRITPLRGFELFEKPRVFVVSLGVCVALFALFYNQRLVRAFSFHVSQKHIIETVESVEGGKRPTDRLFRIGLTGARSRRNFYMKDIPEAGHASERKSALRAVASVVGQRKSEPGNVDELLTLTTPDKGLPVRRVYGAWSPANDTNSDGRRDHRADAGVATGASSGEHWLEDRDKRWVQDEWVGYLLIDSDGWSFPIVGNGESRLTYDPARAIAPPKVTAKKQQRRPAYAEQGGARNRYTVDHPDAKDHAATAMAPRRLYLLLPKVGDHPPAHSDTGSFSDLNHQYRQVSGGRHLAVLDDRSSKILLATSHLQPGETDHNWLRNGAGTLSNAQFKALAERGAVRGPLKGRELEGIVNWEDKVTLLGWSMDKYAVTKGKKFVLKLFFRSLAPITKSHKIFLHLDRSGHRIHSDHWPLAVSKGKDGKHCIGCFQTDHWMPGDIIVDTFERDVPFGAPAGETEVFLGLFDPKADNKRMSVTGHNAKVVKYHAKRDKNRVRIGSFVVR